MKPVIVVALAALALSAVERGVAHGADDRVDKAFARFWDARSPEDAAKAVDGVIKSGVSIADALARLKRGRPYRADAPRGALARTHRTMGADFNYSVDVPESYDSSRQYKVRVLLHGGVMMRDTGAPRAGRGGPMNVTLRGDEQIYVMPTSWRDAPWWTDAQIDNLRSILDTLKRTYNIDENRVALSGVSDGATAAYYVAMRDTTPYANFEPLNGFIMVLGNESLGIEGDLYAGNLRNKPFFTVNGALDPLYPAAVVGRYTEKLEKSGVAIDYHPRSEGVHSTAWWPDVKDSFESFVREHPRSPIPDRVTWETDRVDRRNRAHWLVIDKLASHAGDQITDDAELFARRRQSGRVELTRRGNNVEATTRGVSEFTVLVSPDAFDLTRPITVNANGRPMFDGKLNASLETLMKWAARDNDRTMLFVAELHIRTN
jgi:predicted esterase